MSPAAFHAAPRGDGASASGATVPAFRSMTRSCPPAKNPIARSVWRPERRHGADRCPAARAFHRCAGPAATATPPRPARRERRADGHPRQARVQRGSRSQRRRDAPRPAARPRAAAGAVAAGSGGRSGMWRIAGTASTAAIRRQERPWRRLGSNRYTVTSDLQEVASHA